MMQNIVQIDLVYAKYITLDRGDSIMLLNFRLFLLAILFKLTYILQIILMFTYYS